MEVIMYAKLSKKVNNFICFILVGLMVACQSPNANSLTTSVISTLKSTNTPEPTYTPVSTATPTLEPTPDMEEIRAAIVKALFALYGRPNRMEVTTVLSEGRTSTNVIEFIPPDRKRIVSDEVEYVVVGGKVYAKTKSSGKWEETQIAASSFLGDGKVTEDGISGTINDEQFLRKDTLDGKSVIVYSYSSTTKSAENIELNSQTELWVGLSDGLPYKMITDGETLSVSTDPETGKSKMEAVKALTTVLVAFDLPIIIEPPIQ
jgi:hypothetical protein